MTEIKTGKMFLLPPKPDVCQTCAVDHAPEQPHNWTSLYYQMKFKMENGRAPTWVDAMAHCSDETKAFWRDALAEHGIEVGDASAPEREGNADGS